MKRSLSSKRRWSVPRYKHKLHEVPDNSHDKKAIENLDGVQYSVAELSTTYLFPQRTGKLTIQPIELDWGVRIRAKRQQSLFDQFFGGGTQDLVVKIKSKPITVDVQALPEKGKPENFTGAVGNFSFNAKLNHNKVKANESINLKLTISGKGNISLASTPKLNFPEGFETYDPKVNESISSTVPQYEMFIDVLPFHWSTRHKAGPRSMS